MARVPPPGFPRDRGREGGLQAVGIPRDGAPARLSLNFGAFSQCAWLLQTPLSSCAGFQHKACGDYSLSHVVGLESLQDSDLSVV
jgi:hypothetical protein